MHVQQDAGGNCYISPFMVKEHPRYIIIGENEPPTIAAKQRTTVGKVL